MKHNSSIVFTIINIIAIIILPFLILSTILYELLTSPVLYATILKQTDFIETFVQAKNLEITQNIQDEIDKKVGLASYTLTYQAIQRQYQEAKQAYELINKDSEYEKLQQQYDEIKRLSYNDVRQAFDNKELFERNKAAELEKIKTHIASIEQYRKDHKDDIEAAKKKLQEIEDAFEDARDEYNEKQEEANKIIQKHRTTFAAQLNDDLKLLKPAFTKIINEKLIDGNIIPLVEKYINFFTSYDAIKSEYILELTDTGNPLYPKKVLQILLPDITISLWTHENGVKKHILSNILVEEIKNTPDLKNKVFLTTVFTFADSAIGELLARSFLKKYGVWFDNGVIYKHNIVLTGDTADSIITIIQILSYARYLVYITAILSVLYLLFILLSAADRKAKLLWLKRLLVYPSGICVLLGVIGILLPFILIKQSQSLSLLSAQIVRTIALHTSLCIMVPVMVVFVVLCAGGLLVRKMYLRMQ